MEKDSVDLKPTSCSCIFKFYPIIFHVLTLACLEITITSCLCLIRTGLG